MWNLLTPFLQVLTTASYHLWGERHREKKIIPISTAWESCHTCFLGWWRRAIEWWVLPPTQGPATFTGTHTRQHRWLWDARGHRSPVVRWPHHGHYATTGQGGLTWHLIPAWLQAHASGSQYSRQSQPHSSRDRRMARSSCFSSASMRWTPEARNRARRRLVGRGCRKK